MLPLLYPDAPTSNTFAEPGDNVSASQMLKTGIDVLTKSAGPAGVVGNIAGKIISDPQAYGRLLGATERQTRLTETAFSDEFALEEAYNRRIAAVKAATGVTLENPERGGYSLSERELRRLSVDGPIDPTAHRRLTFEGKVRELQQANPDKIDALTFGDLQAESQAIAKGSEPEYETARKQPGLDPAASLVTQFAGGMWGQSRDPIFVGSMFAGPTSAVGKTVAARIVTSGVLQGLYNMGITLLEQPAVQAWREEIGVRAGLAPAAENVALAFLSGVIPGAALRGAHEAITVAGREAIERVIGGNPKAGDIEVALKFAGGDREPQVPPRPLEERLAALSDEASSLVTERGVGRGGRIAHTVPEEDQALHAALKAASSPAYIFEDNMAAVRWAKEHGRDDIVQAIVDRARRRLDAPIEEPTVGKNDPEYNQIAENLRRSRETAASEARSIIDLAEEGAAPRSSPTLSMQPHEVAAARVGEAMDEMERVTRPPVPKDVPEALHDDLAGAAQRYGDDPLNSPSPAAVATIDQLQQKRPLTLEKVHAEPEGSQYPESWSVTDESGNQIATISAKIEGNTARIENIYAGRNPALATSPEERAAILAEQQNALGPSAVRDILRQFMEQNPDVERITGERISGARFGGEYNANRGVEAEVRARVAAAQPASQREAQMAASEALEDIGNRSNIARVTTDLDAGKKFYTLEETFEAPTIKASSKDPLDKVPLMRDDGTATMVSPQQAARAGERETALVDIMRECK